MSPRGRFQTLGRSIATGALCALYVAVAACSGVGATVAPSTATRAIALTTTVAQSGNGFVSQVPAATSPSVTETPPAAATSAAPATPTGSTPISAALATTTVPGPLNQPSVGLQLIAQGLIAPVALAAPPDGSGRLFIVEQTGAIRIISAAGALLPNPFLDLRARLTPLTPGYDERGLLGLAFHPQYAQNGRFFVYYSAPARSGAPAGWNHTDRLAEFHVSSGDANSADSGSERIVLEADHPNATHNGGGILFGPDGYLYVPLGDGGGPGDVRTAAQDSSMLLGKILRLDVDKQTPYAIPPDNPFAAGPGRPEIYAYGFRNPFRIAFDSGGDHGLYVEDAGEDLWEEVDRVVKGGNYGWPVREGAHCFNARSPLHSPAVCASAGADGSVLLDPIVEYPNIKAPGGIGMVGVGGMIYRGAAIPAMQGRYLFGDWGTNYSTPDGTLLIASPLQTGLPWSLQRLSIAGHANGRLNEFVRGFGEDLARELYVLTSRIAGPRGATGRVYKLVSG